MTIEDADEADWTAVSEKTISVVFLRGGVISDLTQADDKALPVILERLKRNGFEERCDVPVKETAGVES